MILRVLRHRCACSLGSPGETFCERPEEESDRLVSPRRFRFVVGTSRAESPLTDGYASRCERSMGMKGGVPPFVIKEGSDATEARAMICLLVDQTRCCYSLNLFE